MTRTHRIAVIAGDGIGQEVMPEGVRALQSAAEAYGFELKTTEFDYASADYYLKHGTMLPDGWFEQLSTFDAIFFGAVGCPRSSPTTSSLWG
ncbi:tartrate dehydrogenase, partial [Methylobacterium radiotolerans]